MHDHAAADRRVPLQASGRWRTVLTVGRAAPFVVVAVASVWRAGRAPQGRRPPRFDWTVDAESVLRALTKWPHVASMSMLFVLAAVAVGMARLRLAAAMTLAVGVGWEIVQTTVVGHNPRVVDLLPDVVGILAAWALVAGAYAAVKRIRAAVRARAR